MSANPGFDKANRNRTDGAAVRTIAEARKALITMRKWDGHPSTRKYPGMFNTYYETLVARINHPRDSLAQIGAALGTTKHSYSARLRRALRYAQRLERLDA